MSNSIERWKYVLVNFERACSGFENENIFAYNKKTLFPLSFDSFFHYFCFAKSIKQSFVIGVSAIYFPTFLIVDIKQSSIIYLSTELKCWDRAEFFGWIELLGLIKENRNSLESSWLLILKTNSIIVFVWDPRKLCCLNIVISDFFKIVF